MGRLTRRANRGFMMGSIVMMVMLFAVVFIFILWAFRIDREMGEKRQYNNIYTITLGESVAGEPLHIYLNDSLLFGGITASPLTLTIRQFSDNNTLLLVDDATTFVSLIELPESGGSVTIEKQGGEFRTTHP